MAGPGTISHDRRGASFVPEAVVETLRQAQRGQFDLCVISFCSSIDTQRSVTNRARTLESRLIRPFPFVHTCNRHSIRDPLARRASLTGCTTAKAEQVNWVGTAAFVDDQAALLKEVEGLQQRRARGNKTRCLISHRDTPSRARCELKDLLDEEGAGDFPLPSFLRSLV